MSRARILRLLAVAAAIAGSAGGAARGAEAPPDWRVVYDFMIQDACVDAAGAPLIGVSPLDGPARCPVHRDLRVGERLPYHKHDWAELRDRAAQPDGVQRSDSFPIRTRRLGVAVVQTFDFGTPPRRFDRFDAGDGGQLAIVSAGSVFYGLTEDGGDGLQLFRGPDCASPDPAARLRDSWVLVDRTFAPGRPGERLARLTKWPDRCPHALSNAFTRWHTRALRLRVRSGGHPDARADQTLISDHFGGRDPEVANHLERFYFTRALGYVRWERWENLARPGAAIARANAAAAAAALATSDRCDPVAEPPAPTGTWIMIDCRQWTHVVPPADPAGDPPRFWVDRLAAHPDTRDLMAE
jgi:hypothetical protein